MFDILSQSSLLFLISLSYPFHLDFLLKFYNNHAINSKQTTIQSCVCGKEIFIIEVDLYLQVFNTDLSAHFITIDLHYNWSTINSILRDSLFSYHQPLVSELVLNAHIIQHMLRHNVMSKVGDRINITHLLYVITYFYMTNTSFDIADLFDLLH